MPGEPAEPLAARVAANDAAPEPEWRTLQAEAVRIGMLGRDKQPSTRAMRRFCASRGVEIRGEGWHSFVDRREVDRAIARLPARGRARDDAPPAAVIEAGFAALARRKGR